MFSRRFIVCSAQSENLVRGTEAFSDGVCPAPSGSDSSGQAFQQSGIGVVDRSQSESDYDSRQSAPETTSMDWDYDDYLTAREDLPLVSPKWRDRMSLSSGLSDNDSPKLYPGHRQGQRKSPLLGPRVSRCDMPTPRYPTMLISACSKL